MSPASLEERRASIRELLEETGVEAEPFCEVGVADAPGRDPRGWVVSVVWAFVVPAGTEAKAGDDADDEGDQILRPAFAVSGEPTNEHAPPCDGFEYLRRVRKESNAMPAIVRARVICTHATVL